MKNNLTLYTCVGGLKIVYLKEFVRGIQLHKVDSDVVSYAKPVNNPKAVMYSDDYPDYANNISYQRIDVKLNDFRNLSAMDLLEPHRYDSEILKQIEKELKLMIAKKTPDFFIKDLSIEEINNLANEHCKDGGSSDFACHIDLGPYQKFFVIADINDFCFYLASYRKIDRNETVLCGKLVNKREDRLKMFRYENLTYLNELSSMNTRYTS